eukprot:TRINITY_DN1149_c0_g1_i1.p1 TRINITY_DN1149_c0_g1~~TRINITY_DN1149_c0_g1_i1.p1  ORF type:complete len:513 (+),score=194.27 TRINITY_DN1149_c0_g1_i1:77-1615(+)
MMLAAAAAATLAAARPHIIFIMADDQGWNNIGSHNGDLITPHTKELVAEGVELSRHYVFKFCSPTRCSLLSGRLPIHVNQENSATEQPLAGIPLNMTAFPVLLRSRGYATHHVGKWHAGQATPGHIPTGQNRGFDTALSFFNWGEDHYTQVRGGRALANDGGGLCPDAVDLYGSHEPAYGRNGTYGGYLFTEEAVARIRAHNASRPLFMYIAFQNLHPPLQVPQSYIDRYDGALRTTINGMATFLDESVGNVTAALKASGLWPDTLLVYSPDNGGYQGQGGDDTPLRGGKFSDFEGGTRSAAFISGGFVPRRLRGTQHRGLIHVADWYATFCALAGVPDVTDHAAARAGLPPLDSLDQSGALFGGEHSPRGEVVLSANPNGTADAPLYFGDGEAVIAADAAGVLWKLVTGTQLPVPTGPAVPNRCRDQNTTVWGPSNTGVRCTCGAGCLYNLDEDEEEHNDLSAANPAKLAELQAKLRAARGTVYAPYRGDVDEAACAANERAGGYWVPWLP